MKPQVIAAIAFACFSFMINACKKETPQQSKLTTTKCYIVSDSDATSKRIYSYDNLNRLSKVNDISGVDTSTNIVEYTGKIAVISSNKSNTVQTIYLNAAGHADSIQALTEGIVNIWVKFKYDIDGNAVEQDISGTIGKTTIDETITSQYLDGNETKTTTVSNNLTTSTTFEYYADINYSAPSEEALNFMKGNRNLLKKATNNDGTFTNYTYVLDNNGKVVKMTSTNQDNKATYTINSWLCKNQ